MDEIKFSEIYGYIPIFSEKQYRAFAGKEVQNDNKVNSSELNAFESFNFKNICVNNKLNEDKHIKILETANINLKNEFIKQVNNIEKQETVKEKERIARANKEFPYKKVNVLTNAETQLYNFMKNNLCQVEKIEIFPKVRLADIVNLDEKISTNKKYLWKITNKHVDFLICKADTLETICVIELDDYTHESDEAKEKDMFIAQVLRAAGIELVRIKTKISVIDKSDLEYAEYIINSAIAPNCPYCGVKMVPRKSFHHSNKGHRFYGCVNYSANCRYTIDIDPVGEKLP